MPDAAPVLELKDVCRDFSHGIFRTKTVHAVDHVSFSLERGRTYGLVGNSGCGKTTLSRMITRLLRPTSGEIRFQGENIADLNHRDEKRYHRKVQMIFQNPEASLDPSMTIRESLSEALAIHRLCPDRDEAADRIHAVLRRVGVPADLLSRYPHQISGGEGQRLIICRALLLEPEVLLLDEPTSMLDVSVQAHIMHIFRDLQEDMGLTYLYITHDIELLGWISHTIGVMREGRIVEQGPRDQIIGAPEHPYTKKLLHSYDHWE